MLVSKDNKSWTEVWRARQVRRQWNVRLARSPGVRYVKLGLREAQYVDLKYAFVYEAASGK